MTKHDEKTNDRMYKDLIKKTLNTPFLSNEGEYCDRKYHVDHVSYRIYRRGKNRCSGCGAKIGEPKLRLVDLGAEFIDVVLSKRFPLLDMLKKNSTLIKGNGSTHKVDDEL